MPLIHLISLLELKMKEKRMAEAEKLKEEKGDNYNMKVKSDYDCKEFIVGQVRKRNFEITFNCEYIGFD